MFPEKIQKGGPGITKSDFFINKTDLSSMVGALEHNE